MVVDRITSSLLVTRYSLLVTRYSLLDRFWLGWAGFYFFIWMGRLLADKPAPTLFLAGFIRPRWPWLF
jgi:hypothetical protein